MGMRAKHLKIWIVEVWEEDNHDPYRWHIFVDMVQLAFDTW